jgi:hypothetical protein
MNIEEILEKQLALMEMMIASKAVDTPVRNNAPGNHRQRNQAPMMAPIRQKHTLIENPPWDHAQFNRPLYDSDTHFGGFFQDCALDNGLLNLLIHPVDGIANDIPIRPNNNIDSKHGFLTRYNIDEDEDFVDAGGPCDPCIPIISDMDFCKMNYPYAGLCRSISTIDVTQLILRACQNQFDDFYIIGNYRGVSDSIPNNTFNDSELIKVGAVQRKMSELGTYFQRWVLKHVWTGDPANGDAGGPNTRNSQFYGLLRLINGNYPASGLPLEGAQASLANCSALNSVVFNAAGNCIGNGTFSTYAALQEMEQTLYQRAAGTGVLPVQWRIYMVSTIWDELVRNIACEMAADGCTVPGGDPSKVLNMNDGGMALMNITAREQMRRSMTLTLNGRTYPVYLDDTMPYTKAAAVAPQTGFTYTSSIFFIPFTAAGGEQVLYWEHIDYSQIYGELGALAADATGWTDGGIYWHQISQERNCIELQTQMSLRLIFKAPHLAGRIDNLCANVESSQNLFFDGAGAVVGGLAVSSTRTQPADPS